MIDKTVPNLYIAGQIYTGKSRITRVLANDYGYYPIYSGNYLLDKLRQKTGEQRPFSNDDVVKTREDLTKKYGPLFILQEAPQHRPLVIDGVRSTEIAHALNYAGFFGSSYRCKFS